MVVLAHHLPCQQRLAVYPLVFTVAGVDKGLMGRNVCTLRVTAHVPSDGALVLDTPLPSGATGACSAFPIRTGRQRQRRRCRSVTSSALPSQASSPTGCRIC